MDCQGSLDEPPVIFVRRREVTTRQLGLSALFTAIALAFTFEGWREHFAGYVPGPRSNLFEMMYMAPAGGAMFGFIAVLALIALAHPPTLRISSEGFEYRGIIRRAHWRWEEVCNFRPYQPRASSNSNTPLPSSLLFDYTAAHRTTLSDRIIRLLGFQGTLSGGWPALSVELIDLLNSAQARWSGARPQTAVSSNAISGEFKQFTESRLVTVFILATELVIFAVVGFQMRSDLNSVLAFWVAVALIILMGPWIVHCLWPDRVTIDRDGVTVRQLGITRRWGWTYGRFRLQRCAHGQQLICFDALQPGPWPATVSFMARSSGLGALPALWTVPVSDVIDALNTAANPHLRGVASSSIVQ